VQRYPIEWAAALRDMISREPELLLPAHGLPIAGRERIARVLGDIATAARPTLLVLYHQLFFGASDSTLVAEVRSRFRGRVVSARDLDRF
jgi:hypothetical protein